MFKALKMKIAARRLNKKTGKRANKKKTNVRKSTFWARVWNIICAPFRAIWRGLCTFWRWVRGIDLIGLVNITLLSAIIVLFSMLIMDMVGCHKKPVVIIAKPNPVENVMPQVVVSEQSAPRIVRERANNVLPVRRDANRKFIGNTVQVGHVKPDAVAIKQTARQGKVMYGDVIIDSRGAATMLKPGDVVRGNLYLQNMRKYILPRDMRIEGNLFLRDLGMLQFGGDFTVTGNIYVTPTSSFGPIPKTARIGGQVIL